MVRIVVADEHAIYRTGLRVILQAALPGVEFLEAADLDVSTAVGFQASVAE
ncbi:hypothetical protein [Bosea sp. (in: a-proteobacteria)]|uniref:hypothetical protein n=1 Tax=Bosea sp. (in: a-proteobacteria) TaxID=1871050 RepID=UPI0026077102|nr:hypothetical protein [Bosea sp. (in: a-proteobacteria)]MCO5090986.1 hypothetical protein [Bosea sp. (in: a-proteobacteria)]